MQSKNKWQNFLFYFMQSTSSIQDKKYTIK